jgi:hypothetical protein
MAGRTERGNGGAGWRRVRHGARMARDNPGIYLCGGKGRTTKSSVMTHLSDIKKINIPLHFKLGASHAP